MISRKAMFSLIGIALASVLALAPDVFAVRIKPIGRVTALKGRVTIQRVGKVMKERARLATPIYLQDKAETAKKAKVKFLMNDDSVITLAEKTRMTFDRFVYNPEKKERRSLFRMAFGKAKFLVGRLLGFRSRYRVNTPTATIGIRGTYFVVFMVGNETFALALEGTLTMSSTAAPEVMVEIPPGFISSAAPGAAAAGPVQATQVQLSSSLEGLDVSYVLEPDTDPGATGGSVSEVTGAEQILIPEFQFEAEGLTPETDPTTGETSVTFSPDILITITPTPPSTLPSPPGPPQ